MNAQSVPKGEHVMKWVTFVLVLVVAAWAAWYFGILKGVEEPFDTWRSSCIRWISSHGI